MFQLLIDPELLLPENRARAPHALINRHEVVKTVFGYHSADHVSGPKCRRCGRLLHVHEWQFVDGDGDVLDCAVRP